MQKDVVDAGRALFFLSPPPRRLTEKGRSKKKDNAEQISFTILDISRVDLSVSNKRIVIGKLIVASVTFS